jgi:DNA-directed RNA polymerase beta subunit
LPGFQAIKLEELVMNNTQNTQTADWKEEIQRKLDERGIIAVEGSGVLTANDVLTAIKVVDQLETGRDETEELSHIKNLQRERAARLSGGSVN